jgi:hypothetical protein
LEVVPSNNKVHPSAFSFSDKVLGGVGAGLQEKSMATNAISNVLKIRFDFFIDLIISIL